MSLTHVVTSELNSAEPVAVAFDHAILTGALNEVRRVMFPAHDLRCEQARPLGTPLLVDEATHCFELLLELEPDMLALVSASNGNGSVAIAGRDAREVERVAHDFAAVLRDRPDGDPHQLTLRVWTYAEYGPETVRRRIEVPQWGEIRDGYPEDVRGSLDTLAAATGPGPGGLVLWHGEPGTGKSYALRALARAWAPWCDTLVVSDPEAFLGRGVVGSEVAGSGSRYRLVVLEDAGELLAADAREHAGQGLSRLLNLTDGILGAGLRTIVLVTTNEPLGRLHPAVARPGRCWAEVEFGRLAASESDAWLVGRGLPARDRMLTLAELYALKDGREVAEPAPVGFAA
jgi:ATPase family associated with various cellular activities (AAA)